MAVKYTLELFPTEGNWDQYMKWLVGKELSEISLSPSGGATILGTNENAGVDLYCVLNQTVAPGAKATLLDLGVKARMIKHSSQNNIPDEPCHFWLAPRSSIWKSGVRQANSLGVIDRSYRGVLMGAALTNSDSPAEIEAGTRLFQVIAPDMGYISKVRILPESQIDTTIRGEGGFGSTGR
jgi:dUTP pyrophosphatase